MYIFLCGILWQGHSGALATRSLSSEIVYNLSAMRNIGSALKSFGISDACDAVLFVLVEPTKDQLSALHKAVDGEVVEDVTTGLANGVDLETVKKIYDLTDSELSCGSLEDSIVTRIAIRDVK